MTERRFELSRWEWIDVSLQPTGKQSKTEVYVWSHDEEEAEACVSLSAAQAREVAAELVRCADEIRGGSNG